MDRATIVDSQQRSVEFQFNPDTLKFTKEAEWREQTSQSSQDAGTQQFVGTKPIVLSLDMLLDDTVGSARTVDERVALMLGWLNPEPSSDPPTPVKLKFKWGMLKIGLQNTFECHCEAVTVDYLMFREDGTPVRAKASVKLKGVKTSTEGQNPTSGALAPMRSRQLVRGDDLGVIANAEYGSTHHWRTVAALNRIDNPFRLPLGRELVLPDRIELSDWATQRMRQEEGIGDA